MRVGIALGSNIGARLANFHAARKAIVNLAGVSGPILSSSIYETEPVDCEPGAEKFFNAVLEIAYQGDPRNLLMELKKIERSLGRPANHSRNVSSQLHLDLLSSSGPDIEKRT